MCEKARVREREREKEKERERENVVVRCVKPQVRCPVSNWNKSQPTMPPQSQKPKSHDTL